VKARAMYSSAIVRNIRQRRGSSASRSRGTEKSASQLRQLSDIHRYPPRL
jgi:hypothetical protein